MNECPAAGWLYDDGTLAARQTFIFSLENSSREIYKQGRPIVITSSGSVELISFENRFPFLFFLNFRKKKMLIKNASKKNGSRICFLMYISLILFVVVECVFKYKSLDWRRSIITVIGATTWMRLTGERESLRRLYGYKKKRERHRKIDDERAQQWKILILRDSSIYIYDYFFFVVFFYLPQLPTVLLY
jgi:hypothetical protein